MALGKIYKDEKISKHIDVLALLTGIFAIASIGLGLYWKNDHTVIKGALLSLWIVGVPAWFAIEYFHIYKRYGLSDTEGGNFGHFKHGQEVATKAWLAIITVLTGLYFGKDVPFFPGSEKHVVIECKQCPCQESNR